MKNKEHNSAIDDAIKFLESFYHDRDPYSNKCVIGCDACLAEDIAKRLKKCSVFVLEEGFR